MEFLVFGHSGTPLLVFPTSMGRFYDYEDRGMIQAIASRFENGEIQAFCVDSVDNESWYNNSCGAGGARVAPFRLRRLHLARSHSVYLFPIIRLAPRW